MIGGQKATVLYVRVRAVLTPVFESRLWYLSLHTRKLKGDGLSLH